MRERLLDGATAARGAHFLGTDTTAAAADGGQPHESSMTSTSRNKFHVNTPNVMWLAIAVAMVANGTGATTAVAIDVSYFDVLQRAETETYTDGNRHAANKLRSPPNSFNNSRELKLQMQRCVKRWRRRWIEPIELLIPLMLHDIRAAVGNVDIGLRNGDDEVEVKMVEMADMAAENDENVMLQHTVKNIWDITVSLNILYKEYCPILAALEIIKFQDQLVKSLVMDLALSTAGDTGGDDVTDVIATATSTTMLHNAHSRQMQQQQHQSFDCYSMEPTTRKHYG